MNPNADRNKFRGLQRHISEVYQISKDTDPTVLHAELNANGWAGVPLNSVQVAIYNLRKKQKKPESFTPNVLITIPLPEKDSVTLSFQDARAVYELLKELFK
jgi:hypothetical protein